jgi:hypothetical protein
MGWLKRFFGPQPEQKNYMAGWEDGYDDGWAAATTEVVQFLHDNGHEALAANTEEYLNGDD